MITEITEKYNPLIPCIRCGKDKHPTQLYYFNGEGGYCVECFIGSGLGKAIIQHNYKPLPVFCHLSTEKESGKTGISKKKGKGKDHKLLYMGIELEIENRSGDSSKYAYEMQIKYPIYIKHDGSLQNGLELVSHPQTAKYHQKIFNWYNLLEGLRKDRFTSYDNGRCGLHIHVNKDFFNGRNDILKVVLFFYKCFNKIERFAKRKNMNYCKKWEQSLIDYVESYKTGVGIAATNEDRYTCVNLQNRNTVEFRIYRGTLNYDRFLASILFTDAVCFFAKNYSIAFFANKKYTGVILWKKFIEFIEKNDRYEFLKKYLKRHKLDSGKISKDALPKHEDYIGKGYKIEIERIEDLYALCGGGLERYILTGLSYEFVKDELAMINFKDSDSYYIVSKIGSPEFITPKNISRVLLDKKHVDSMKISKIIKVYLGTCDYTLRIFSGEMIYKEIYNWYDMFPILGISSETVALTVGLGNFIEETDFKYELIRSDVISVYNNMQANG